MSVYVKSNYFCNLEIKVQQQLLTALQFAAEKHKGQFRKGLSKTPFINHPIKVANILADNEEADNTVLLQAAILHDTVEDTNTTVAEIKKVFGEIVCSIVSECTDDKNLSSQLRKQAQIDCAAIVSTNAKKLKLADKIANIKDIILDPPVGWSIERRLNYLDWANKVCSQINGVNQNLEKLFEDELFKAKAALLAEAELV